MDKLYSALSFGGILSPDSIEDILTYYEEVNLAPQEDFLSAGSISDKIGFVNKGILRVYTFDKDGGEVTKYFVRSHQFVVDLESYYNLTSSEVTIQAVVASQLFCMKRNVWNRLSETYPKLYMLMKSLSEMTLLNKIKDNDFLNFGTAQDKYLEFVKRYPDLALQVPQQYIASYLKITPQSLSRIRKNLTDQTG